MYHKALENDLLDGEPLNEEEIEDLKLKQKQDGTDNKQQENKYITQSQETLTHQQLVIPIVDFFKEQSNFDAMPGSSKVIVFDIDIKVSDAFSIAAENDISFACLWDSQEEKLVGMLTVTDLIAILLHYHNKTSVIKDLIANHTVRRWREISKRNRSEALISIHPEQSLWDSILILKKHKIHRLPIVSDTNLHHVSTHAHLLTYLCSHCDTDIPIFQRSLESLGIGTFKQVCKVTKDQKVHRVLELFSEKNISAIPVVDENDVFIDVYSRYDVVYLVRDGDIALDGTIEDALKTCPPKPAFTCEKTQKFGTVVNHLSHTRIHRLVVVDDEQKLLGIISISDIFSFLVDNAPVDSDDSDDDEED